MNDWMFFVGVVVNVDLLRSHVKVTHDDGHLTDAV